MDPITIAIGTGLASTALWEGGKFGWQTFRVESPLRRFYRFPKKRRVIIVQSAIKNPDPKEFYRYLAAPDSVEGYKTIWNHLREISHPADQSFLKFAPEVSGEDLKCDLILIGGYENNSISELLNRRDRPIFLRDNKIHVRDDPSLVWNVTTNSAGKIVRDYCLITRVQNPWAADGASRELVSFEGVRHFGTQAGVEFVTPAVMRRKPLSKSKKGDLYIVVSCVVDDLNDGYYHLSSIRPVYLWANGKGFKLA